MYVYIYVFEWNGQRWVAATFQETEHGHSTSKSLPYHMMWFQAPKQTTIFPASERAHTRSANQAWLLLL